MSRRFALPFALAAAAAFGSYAAQAAADEPAAVEAANPFFAASTLPYQVPPFDQIRDEHYLPAFERGMAEELVEIEAIANNPEAPTLENTIVAMEQTGDILARVSRVFFNLNSAHTNEAMQEVQKAVSPQLAAHRDAIFLNPKLFARVEALYAKADSLELDRRVAAPAGALPHRLRARRRAPVRGRQGQAAGPECGTRLAGHHLCAERAARDPGLGRDRRYRRGAGRLLGREDPRRSQCGHCRAAMRASTSFPCRTPRGQPPLALLSNRALRQRIHEASVNRGARDNEHDNRPVVARVAALRAERAALLGYPNHAAFVLENATAGTPAAVNEMLAGLAPAAVANARKEAADIQALINAQGGEFELEAWDWDFYAEQVRKQALRPRPGRSCAPISSSRACSTTASSTPPTRCTA